MDKKERMAGRRRTRRLAVPVYAPASSGMSSCWGARDTSLGVPGFMHCKFSNPKVRMNLG
jgi:hypothetical protein